MYFYEAFSYKYEKFGVKNPKLTYKKYVKCMHLHIF